MAYYGPIYQFDRHPSRAPLTQHDINIGHRLFAALSAQPPVAHPMPQPLPLPRPQTSLANYPESGRMYFGAAPAPPPVPAGLLTAIQQQMQFANLLAAMQQAFSGQQYGGVGSPI